MLFSVSGLLEFENGRKFNNGYGGCGAAWLGESRTSALDDSILGPAHE
jgi:hypothetical protein